MEQQNDESKVSTRQHPDGKYTVRVEFPNGKVYVHTGEPRKVAELVKTRYLSGNIKHVM